PPSKLAPYESPKTPPVNPEIVVSAKICQSSASCAQQIWISDFKCAAKLFQPNAMFRNHVSTALGRNPHVIFRGLTNLVKFREKVW
ncbi:hypothetical protein, partial [Paracoccus saliphilus]|uniref:hypothetical protein n=1 Tax=Paracoccus saliphilus TaxID=405559 RepID=UPI0026575C21